MFTNLLLCCLVALGVLAMLAIAWFVGACCDRYYLKTELGKKGSVEILSGLFAVVKEEEEEEC